MKGKIVGGIVVRMEESIEIVGSWGRLVGRMIIGEGMILRGVRMVNWVRVIFLFWEIVMEVC